jgi:hypothetical protein
MTAAGAAHMVGSLQAAVHVVRVTVGAETPPLEVTGRRR